MRLKIMMRPESGNATLDWNYQYKIAGMLYNALRRGSKRLSRVYHTSNNFKMFTYSWLCGKLSPSKTGLMVDGIVSFKLSSIDNDFLQTVFEGLMKGDVISIGNAEFEILKTKVIDEPDFYLREKWRMKTLSPILVRTYVDGKINPHWDLEPTSTMFFSNIRNNILKKYSFINFNDPEDKRFDFEQIKILKRKRINIKGSWHRAWMMKFVVKGNPELIELAYKAGLGEKNSMGFGMIEVV